jgi:hypothetical protein
MSTPDHEKLIRWLRGLAENTVTNNGSRRSFVSDMYFEAADAIASLQTLEERLEVTSEWHSVPGNPEQLVKVAIPPENRPSEIDGIECRDATIKIQDDRIASLHGALAAIKALAAEAYAFEFPVHGADIARCIAKGGALTQDEFENLVAKHSPEAAQAMRDSEPVARAALSQHPGEVS